MTKRHNPFGTASDATRALRVGRPASSPTVPTRRVFLPGLAAARIASGFSIQMLSDAVVECDGPRIALTTLRKWEDRSNSAPAEVVRFLAAALRTTQKGLLS
jgi:hypothetical protein